MRKYLFRILSYFIWTALSFMIAIVYMRIVLGSKPEPTSGLMMFFELLYEYAFVHIGMIIGSIIAVLYILIDVFYLNKKLEKVTYSIIIRFLFILTISILVGAIHYMLEKVVDVI